MGTIASPRFYVYVLARPDGTPFYVGKGQKSRVQDHEREARNGHHCQKCHTIRKIWKQGGQVQKYIIFTTDDEQEALDYERTTIALYGRATLANIADGGQGSTGYTPTPEQRARRGASVKAARSTSESRAKSSAATRAAWQDPEKRERRLSALRAKLASPEYREKKRQEANARYKNPAERESQSHRMQDVLSTPEMRQKLSVAQQGSKKPGISAAHKKRYADPAVRAEHSERMKAWWAKRKEDRNRL